MLLDRLLCTAGCVVEVVVLNEGRIDAKVAVAEVDGHGLATLLSPHGQGVSAKNLAHNLNDVE